MNIRDARPDDAPELAALTTELGYPSAPDDIVRRLPHVPGRLLVMAGDDDRAIAWIHVAIQYSIEDDSYAQILGLVVAASHRGAGIGAQLVAEGERWAREQGMPLMRVRSNIVRERTHRFYMNCGYALRKTSYLFVKDLRPQT